MEAKLPVRALAFRSLSTASLHRKFLLPPAFPKEDQLFQLLEKARKESLQVTLTFSYIREFMLENTGQLIEKLENWCEENKVILEIQVNDWAMAEMLKGKSFACSGTWHFIK